MKYIRMKDGNLETIYELQDNGDWTRKGNLCLDKSHFRYEELQNHIIKQVDTIEELCDEFVIKGKNWYQIISLENAKHNAQIGRLNELEIYGAIWTDEGLIYVAKMNEKGVLELL